MEIPNIVSILKNAAESRGFDDLEVHSGSIQAISADELPTDSFISTTDSPISTNDPTGKEEERFQTAILSFYHFIATVSQVAQNMLHVIVIFLIFSSMRIFKAKLSCYV